MGNESRNGFKRWLLLLIACMAWPAVSRSQTTNQPPPVAPADKRLLTLGEAKQAAFERNWDLLAAKSGIDAAAAQLIVAKEFPNPALALSSAKIGSGNATAQGGSLWHRSYDTIAAVSQLIEIGGKRRFRQLAAGAGVEGARARFYDAKRLLDQGVTKAYVAALLAGDNARILHESALSLRRQAEIAEVRLKAGDISDSDRTQIEINATQFELQARSAEVAAVQARIATDVLIGREQPDGNWQPGDTLDRLAEVSPPAEEAPAGAARADVLAAEADLKKSNADLKLQKAMRIPDPTIFVEGEHNPPGPPGPDTIGIGLSFPLPLWNQNRGNIKGAEAARDQAALALGRIKTQALADAASAEAGFREARTRWLRYKDQIRPQSTKVRESVAFAYEKGGLSLLNLLEAERTDNDVRLATEQALADTASTLADLIAARAVLTRTERDRQN